MGKLFAWRVSTGVNIPAKSAVYGRFAAIFSGNNCRVTFLKNLLAAPIGGVTVAIAPLPDVVFGANYLDAICMRGVDF
jgi:hypothetical protein